MQLRNPSTVHTAYPFWCKRLMFMVLMISTCFQTLQAGIVLQGRVENQKGERIRLIYNNTAFREFQDTIDITLADGLFSINLDFVPHGFFILEADSQKVFLYFEDKDSLFVQFEAGSLTLSARFKGKAAVHNQFLNEFLKAFGQNMEQAEIEKNIDFLSIDAFEIDQFDNKSKQSQFLKKHQDYTSFSLDFKKTITAYIMYNYYGNLLLYPVHRANNSTALTLTPLPAVIEMELDVALTQQHVWLHYEPYGKFLVNYIVYFTSKENGFHKFTDYSSSAQKKCVYAEGNLSGESKTYFILRFLMDNCNKIDKETLDKCMSLADNNDSRKAVMELINRTCTQVIASPKKIEKTDARGSGETFDFTLIDTGGKEVSLKKYIGKKVVYIDFWASWCGPCRQQIPYAEELKKKFTKQQLKQIEFIYISIDKTSETWKKAMEQHEIEGIHLLSPQGWSSRILQHFQINSIPRYMLIDKNGNIVDPNAKRPGEEGIYEDILKLF